MPTLPCGFAAGSGSASPSIAFMIASTPASIPPAKSPPRKRGATVSAMMRFESASVSVPCTPRPVWMRILRSCLATTKRTPSSTPLRPSFHASLTRPAKSSIVSAPIERTSSTSICDPVACSKAFNFASRASLSRAVSVPVRSTTCAVNFGTATGSAGVAANAAANANNDAAAPITRRPRARFIFLPRLFRRRGCALRRRRGLGSKIHLGRTRDRLLVLDGEGRLFLVAEDHRGQVGRELAREGVVFLDRLDEAVARGGDAVLGSLELRLQVAEIRVALQLRVVLRDHEQARQRARELALRLLEFLQRLRIVERFGSELHGPDLRARLGDAEEDVLFLRGIALHRRHEVRDQVGAALVLVEHLRPRGLHLLVLGLEIVVSAAGKHECEESRHGPQKLAHCFFSLEAARDRVSANDGGSGGRFQAAPRRASRGFAQRAAREDEVLPRLGLLRQAAQEVGRVIGDHERRALVAMHPAAQAGEARFGVEQPHRRGLAEGDDEPGLDELDLPVEVGRARGGLLRRGRAIARRAAFHDIGDVDLAPALDADRREHAVEELAGLPDEGFALLVLIRTRSFADEEPRRRFRAHAEYRLLALLAQAAELAHAHGFAQLVPTHFRREMRDVRRER